MTEDKSDAAQSTGRWRRSRGALRGNAKAWLIGVAAIAVLAWAASWLVHRWTHIYVDDARIDGEVVTVASRVSGWVTELNVIEGDVVKKGQVIARIDERDSLLQREVLQARLKTLESQMGVLRAQSGQVDQETLGKFQTETNRIMAAEADVASMDANLKQAKQDYERAVDLHAQKWLSQQAMERARTTYQQAQETHRKSIADVAAARGALSTAGGSRKQVQVMERQLLVLTSQTQELRAEMQRQEADITDRTIRSPGDGLIVMTFVRKGEHVGPGQRLAMFHDPENIWVEANVKETAIGLLKPGMKADVRIDAYPGRVVHGEVHRIGQAATSKFALLPDPNPSGNFTKITQRLPVRILLKEKDLKLRPGMMVEIDIAVRND
jgi:membrane fusion protein (multidrug efflux system)